MNRALLALPADRTEVYPDRDTWLAGRRAGEHRIGASLVGRILTRPWEALEILTGQAPEHDAATLRVFARGHRWERYVIEEYAVAREVPAMSIGEALGAPSGSLVIVRHPTEPWLCASPDAGTVDPHVGGGLVEAKTDAGGRGWAEADVELRSVGDYTPDVCPADYLTQAYVQLATTELPFVDLVCLLPRYELRVVRVWQDPDTQAEIVEAVGEFRERHILRGEPLPVDGSEACRRLLTRRFPGIGKECRPATADEQALVRAYADAKAAEKAHAAAADEMRNALAEALGDTYGLALGGKAKAILCPVAGRRTIDADALRAAHPDIAERFTRVGEPHRQLRLYGC